jgi:hypothetical protein
MGWFDREGDGRSGELYLGGGLSDPKRPNQCSEFGDSDAVE